MKHWLMAFVLLATGCLGAREVKRNYFVIRPPEAHEVMESEIEGQVRVRDLTPEAVYDKFQLVIRLSPIQLRYSGSNLWAVRPHVMLSDHLAQSLAQHQLFTGVTRQLSEARPDYIISGDLRAVEVQEYEDGRRAHLAFNLRMTRFSDGTLLWSRSFDKVRIVGQREMPEAVQALSELMTEATEEAIADLAANRNGFSPEPDRFQRRRSPPPDPQTVP
jgi:ABC-type uncharacterized transport system auxiliary subunit